MAEHRVRFWFVNALIAVAGVLYVTAKTVLFPVEPWWPPAAYAACLGGCGLLALCHWSLRVTGGEKARGER